MESDTLTVFSAAGSSFCPRWVSYFGVCDFQSDFIHSDSPKLTHPSLSQSAVRGDSSSGSVRSGISNSLPTETGGNRGNDKIL